MQLLRVKDVAKKCGVSVSTVWNWCNPKSSHHIPQFPRPFKISGNITVWSDSSLNEFIVGITPPKRETP